MINHSGKAASKALTVVFESLNLGRERTSRYSNKILLSQSGTNIPAMADCSNWSQTPFGVIAAYTRTLLSMTQ